MRPGWGWQADIRQTDSEAELIGWLHEAADQRLPVVSTPLLSRTTATGCATPQRN